MLISAALVVLTLATISIIRKMKHSSRYNNINIYDNDDDTASVDKYIDTKTFEYNDDDESNEDSKDDDDDSLVEIVQQSLSSPNDTTLFYKSPLPLSPSSQIVNNDNKKDTHISKLNPSSATSVLSSTQDILNDLAIDHPSNTYNTPNDESKHDIDDDDIYDSSIYNKKMKSNNSKPIFVNASTILDNDSNVVDDDESEVSFYKDHLPKNNIVL